eukprot:jgi/Mesen1/7096/ME000369S06425
MQCFSAHTPDEFHDLWGEYPKGLDRTLSWPKSPLRQTSPTSPSLLPSTFSLHLPGSGGNAGGFDAGVCESPHGRFSTQAAGNGSGSGGGGHAQLAMSCGGGGGAFDVVLVDSPITSIEKQVAETKMGRFVMQHELALAMMQLGCACASAAPTFLFLAKHSKAQSSVDVSKLDGVTILSRPMRVNQVEQSLLQVLAKDHLASQVRTIVEEPEEAEDAQLNILIAEDNIVNQRVLLKLLKGLGQENCATAVNGIKVLELMEKGRYDLVLMDVQMPEMDGLTATTHIRTNYPEERQPIVAALTADVGPGIEGDCVEAGMNWYLSKPVRKAELDQLLAKVVQLRRRGDKRNPSGWLEAS